MITMGNAGSTTVMGFGIPNEAGTCIQIFDCGPDGTCRGSGAADDVLIGTGGTDGSGKFTITVSPALRCGELLVAVDTCAMPILVGAPFIVNCTPPAPLLSPAMTIVLAAALALVGLLGVTRMRPTS